MLALEPPVGNPLDRENNGTPVSTFINSTRKNPGVEFDDELPNTPAMLYSSGSPVIPKSTAKTDRENSPAIEDRTTDCPISIPDSEAVAEPDDPNPPSLFDPCIKY
jgi:hypothetical protein